MHKNPVITTIKSLSLTMAMAMALIPSTSSALSMNLMADSNATTKPAGAKATLNLSATSKAVLKYDLSTLPDGTIADDIENAQLTLYVESFTNTPILDVYANSDASWLEASVTSQTQLGASSTAMAKSKVISASQSYVILDIKDIIAEWLATHTTYDQFSLVVSIDPQTQNGKTTAVLTSKESKTYSQPAHMEIELKVTTGIKGDKGPIGPQGPIGPAGPMGPTGPQGPQGLEGPIGVTGAKGDKGDKGDTGPKGDAGAAFTYSRKSTSIVPTVKLLPSTSTSWSIIEYNSNYIYFTTDKDNSTLLFTGLMSMQAASTTGYDINIGMCVFEGTITEAVGFPLLNSTLKYRADADFGSVNIPLFGHFTIAKAGSYTLAACARSGSATQVVLNTPYIAGSYTIQ